MKRNLARLALVAGSFLLVALAMEIGLRLVGYGKIGEREGNVVHHIADEYRHTAVLNSLDLRDEEIPAKREAELRILAVGDSFTYGFGVEEPETFVRQTERLLRKREPGRDIRVINGGIGGGPFRQAAWLREVGLGLEPDVVVQTFFIGNDIYDDLAWRQRGGGVGLKPPPPKSVFMVWMWSRLVQIPAVDRMLFGMGMRYGDRGQFLIEQPELERTAWEQTLDKMLEIRNLLAEARVRYLVLIVPTADQVRFRDDRPKEEDYRLPNRTLTEFLEEHGIAHVDLMPRIEQMPNGSALYYRRNLHWTVAGHDFAAEILTQELANL